jgi:hypothetical protein
MNMKATEDHHLRVAQLTFASVYPHYCAKVLKHQRSLEELHQVIHWLTGFDPKELESLIAENVHFGEFFERAQLHPNAHLITGMICGYRIEELDIALTKKVRYLDKLVDELAKGRKMEKILRTEK